MPLSAPTKISTPFATSGAKNTIPVPSQIGITPGAASYTDGFPPLTMTPLASGGVPPFGQDFNGILYAETLAMQWQQAMAGAYPYDSAFATAVGGYPIGAQVLRSDGLGLWINQSANNSTDPEAGGAGWTPLMQPGVTSVAMTSSNVTLTSLQAGKDFIVITGTLTGNLNLIFPTYRKRWIVTNNTTGAYTITAKTASGGGIVIDQGSVKDIFGDGTNINAITTMLPAASATGTGDAMVADFSTDMTLQNGSTILVRAPGANTVSGVTLTIDGMPALTIKKGNGLPLAVGDIAGADHWLVLTYSPSSPVNYLALANPAKGITATPDASTTAKGIIEIATTAEAQAMADATRALVPATLASALGIRLGHTFSADDWLPLPGGLIVQMKKGAITAVGDQDQTITFPITFPNACLALAVSTIGADTIASDIWFQEKSKAPGSCVVISQWSGSGSIASGATPQIIAIGW